MTSVGKYEEKVKEISTNFAPLNSMFHVYYCINTKNYLPKCLFFFKLEI